MRSVISIAIIVAVGAAAASYFAYTIQGNQVNLASNISPASGSITIITLSGGSLVTGATYRIAPISASNSTTLTVNESTASGRSSAIDGIISVEGMKNGNYSVTQIGVPQGYTLDGVPRYVQVAGKPVSVTFSSAFTGPSSSQGPSQPSGTTYIAKFECGTITGSEGPLRPGRYDTDISVLNKQDFALKILWSASVIHGASTNTVLQNLDAKQATSIVCKNLATVLGISGNFTEGFVFIQTPLDAETLGQLATNGAEIVGRQQNLTDLLDVQAFYTANALDTLPHEIYVDKISFTIVNATTAKISSSMLNKILDVTIPSNLSMISDPEVQVKNALAKQYNLSSQEVGSLEVRIDGVDVAVSATVDDHAISLSHISPQSTG
jgi:hypothetical protein